MPCCMEKRRTGGDNAPSSLAVRDCDIWRRAGKEALVRRTSRVNAPVGGPWYEAMVVVMSRRWRREARRRAVGDVLIVRGRGRF
jgi:hypothetical protein